MSDLVETPLGNPAHGLGSSIDKMSDVEEIMSYAATRHDISLYVKIAVEKFLIRKLVDKQLDKKSLEEAKHDLTTKFNKYSLYQMGLDCSLFFAIGGLNREVQR